MADEPQAEMPAGEQTEEDRLAELKATRSTLEQERIKEIQAIIALGAAIPDSSLLQIRLDTFISFVLNRLGQATPIVRQMLLEQFEIDWETALIERLKAVKGEVRKASLGLGVGASAQQLDQMARHDPGLNSWLRRGQQGG